MDNELFEEVIVNNLCPLIGNGNLFYIKKRLPNKDQQNFLIIKNKSLNKLHLLQKDEMLYMNNQIKKYSSIPTIKNSSTQDSFLFLIIIFCDEDEFYQIIENLPDNRGCTGSYIFWLYKNDKEFINSVEKIIFSDAPKPAKRS
jgi:hypothetical protein